MNFLRRIKVAAKLIFNRLDAAQTWSTHRSYRHAPTQDARFDVRQADRNILAGKVRDLELNNAIVQQLAASFVNYTVGANGLQITPASRDLKWNDAAKAYWKNTCKFIDLCSRQNFGVLQGLISHRWFLDGEIFILKTRGQSKDGRWFPRIQLIESHLVGTPPPLAKEEGKTIIDGVAIDKNGRPTGYYVRVSSDATEYRLVEAEKIIHVFEPSRPGEYRGTSFLHAVINDIHDLDDLQKLEMQAAKRNASDERIIETATAEASDEELLQSGGVTADADGKIRQKQYEDIWGASTKYLFTGDKLHQNPGERASVTTLNFWDFILAKICIGAGISKQLVFPYSIQGTIGRFDIDACTVSFRSRSSVLQQVFGEVYIFVIGDGIRTERDLSDPPSDWVEFSSQAPLAPNADVGRNSAAMLAELKAGATNLRLIYSPRGLDWKEQVDELMDEMAYIKQGAEKRGLNPGAVIEQLVEEAAEPKQIPA